MEASRALSSIYLDRGGRRRRLGGRKLQSEGLQGIRGEGQVELRSLQAGRATLPKGAHRHTKPFGNFSAIPTDSATNF